MVITDFNGGYDVGAGIALQADGSIVVAGKSNGLPYGYDYDFAVARYHSDGSMDASFNGNGRVTTDVGSRYNAATSVALQTDGKIVVAGSASGTGFEVVRYDANGNLDATFNGGGRVATAFDVPGLDDGRGLALQADGKIVVAGSAYDGVHDSIFAVARYHSNGSLDNTFHQDGRVTTDLAKVGDANGSAVALQSDGKIVVVGTASGALAIARYEGMLEFLWGAKVTIVQWSGVVSRDYLVGCDGTSVITRNDLVFHLDGSVTAGVGTPLSAIRTIYLVPNSPQNAAAADRALGFNKYCSPVRRTGFELAGGVLLQERAWNIVVGGTRGKLPQTRPFYAIPRCPAPDDWIVPERRRATFTDESLKQLIAAKARAKFVPPQIVWAKLWLDSTGPLVVGWNQYGFVGERSFGVPSYRRDRVGQEMTIVTDDGGVGIGRITGSNIVASVPAGSSVFTHLYRLASDTGYNVETAVSVLERKREQTLNLAIGYAGTPGGRTVLEHWYNALWAFDGLPDPATSNRSTLPVYPDRVWEVVRSRGLGRWSFLRPVLSGYAVPAGISNDYFIPRKQSTLGNDANKKWAHADVDFDGLADVVLFAPSFSRGTIANSLFIRVRTDSTRPSLGIDSVHAVISGGALLSPLNLELSAGAADSFSIAMGVRLPRSRSYYNATFSVSLTGIDAKKRAAEGLTYKFMNPP